MSSIHAWSQAAIIAPGKSIWSNELIQRCGWSRGIRFAWTDYPEQRRTRLRPRRRAHRDGRTETGSGRGARPIALAIVKYQGRSHASAPGVSQVEPAADQRRELTSQRWYERTNPVDYEPNPTSRCIRLITAARQAVSVGRNVVEEFAMQRAAAKPCGADQALRGFQRLSFDIGIEPAAEDFRNFDRTGVGLRRQLAGFGIHRIRCTAEIVRQPPPQMVAGVAV